MVIDNLCNLTHLWVHQRWVPYGHTVLADLTSVGDRIALRWDHDLRRDFLHPFVAPFFRSAPDTNDSDTAMVYDYPYQSATSNKKVRSCNFMLPIDERTTKVFSIQYWESMPIPYFGAKKFPHAIAQRFIIPLVKPITMEIFRQDGFTVEQEQIAYAAQPDRPIPELNPMVKRFNELTVRKWEDYATYLETNTLTDAQRAEQTRVKVL
jgi:hypothetical protein